MEPIDDQDRIDLFHQRAAPLIQVIALLSLLLGLVAFGVVLGPGFDPDTWQIFWVPLASLTLAGLSAVFAWMLWKRPAILRIDARGVYLPIAFKAPLDWRDIHRIRLLRSKAAFTGARELIVIDPSPGVLAPIRLPVWRRFELKFQKYHGVRIPLHGLDATTDEIVASIERFRPVMVETG